jgi:hypothetical protein
VLRDGVLVGFVPQIPDSDDLDAAAITEIIAGADYDASPDVSAEARSETSTPRAPNAPAAPPSRPRWRDRLRRP